MALWMIPAAMAAAGALKGMTIDKEKEKADRKAAAETMRWSPWTGMQAGPIQGADPFGSALQGGMGGLSLMQGMESADNQNALMKSQQDAYNRQGMANTWGAMNTNGPSSRQALA